MNRKLVVLLVSLVSISAVVQSQNRNEAEEIYLGNAAVAREVLVKFRPAASAALAAIMRDNGIVFSEQVGDAFLLRSSNRDVATLVRDFSARPEVEYAEPNYVIRADGDVGVAAIPNDPSFGQLYGLHNTGQVVQGIAGLADADIDAPEAWDVTKGSKALVIASIDTGVDFAHPDLAANIWSAPTNFTVTVGGVAVTCPAATHGYNAITNACGGQDDNNHGTHTSGTIGAVGNNGVGVVGVNWNVSLMACKFLSAAGSGSTADATQCLEWVRQTRNFFGGAGGGADVIATNNSWGGGPPSLTLAVEIARHNQAGILFVASAGNNGSNNDVTPAFPANYPFQNVISVAATNNRDGLAGFSNFGATRVDLGAPGVDILSTIRNNGYDYFDGTSMASPHVAGAVALLKSACPSLGPQDLKNTILNNVDPIPALAGKTVTGGRLNVNNAIQSCVP